MAISTSPTPRSMSSFMTRSQNLAPSLCSIHNPRISLVQSGRTPMDKRALSERDICTRIIVRGKLVTRGQAKRADYILYFKPNIPLALIEAKDNFHSVGDGMQQALDYARNRYTNVIEESSDFARSVRQQRVLSAIKAEVTGWQALPRGMALADALGGHLHTNLPVFDLAMLVGELTPDRRIELSEGQILEATTNTIGQYVLVVIGRRSPTDYTPLHEYLAAELAEPVAATSTLAAP